MFQNEKSKYHFNEFYKNLKILQTLRSLTNMENFSYFQYSIISKIYQITINNLTSFLKTPSDIEEINELKEILDGMIPKEFIFDDRHLCSHILNIGKVYLKTKSSIFAVLDNYFFNSGGIIDVCEELTGLRFLPQEFATLIDSYKFPSISVVPPTYESKYSDNLERIDNIYDLKKSLICNVIFFYKLIQKGILRFNDIGSKILLQNVIQAIGNCYVAIRDNTTDSNEYYKISERDNIISENFIATRNFIAHSFILIKELSFSISQFAAQSSIENWVNDVLKSIILYQKQKETILKFAKSKKLENLFDLPTLPDDTSSEETTSEFKEEVGLSEDKTRIIKTSKSDIKKFFSINSMDYDSFCQFCVELHQKMSNIELAKYSYDLSYDLYNIFDVLVKFNTKTLSPKEIKRAYKIISDPLFNPEILINFKSSDINYKITNTKKPKKYTFVSRSNDEDDAFIKMLPSTRLLIVNKHIDIVKNILLKFKSKSLFFMSEKGEMTNNPIKYAIENNNIELIKFLIEEFPKNIIEGSIYVVFEGYLNNYTDPRYFDPFSHAVILKRSEILKTFIDNDYYFDSKLKLHTDKIDKLVLKIPLLLKNGLFEILEYIFQKYIKDDFYDFESGDSKFLFLLNMLKFQPEELTNLLVMMKKTDSLKLFFNIKGNDNSIKLPSELSIITILNHNSNSFHQFKIVEFIFDNFKLGEILNDSINARIIFKNLLDYYYQLKVNSDIIIENLKSNMTSKIINIEFKENIRKIKYLKNIIIKLFNSDENEFFSEFYEIFIDNSLGFLKDFISEIDLNIEKISKHSIYLRETISIIETEFDESVILLDKKIEKLRNLLIENLRVLESKDSDLLDLAPIPNYYELIEHLTNMVSIAISSNFDFMNNFTRDFLIKLDHVKMHIASGLERGELKAYNNIDIFLYLFSNASIIEVEFGEIYKDFKNKYRAKKGADASDSDLSEDMMSDFDIISHVSDGGNIDSKNDDDLFGRSLKLKILPKNLSYKKGKLISLYPSKKTPSDDEIIESSLNEGTDDLDLGGVESRSNQRSFMSSSSPKSKDTSEVRDRSASIYSEKLLSKSVTSEDNISTPLSYLPISAGAGAGSGSGSDISDVFGSPKDKNYFSISTKLNFIDNIGFGHERVELTGDSSEY